VRGRRFGCGCGGGRLFWPGRGSNRWFRRWFRGGSGSNRWARRGLWSGRAGYHRARLYDWTRRKAQTRRRGWRRFGSGAFCGGRSGWRRCRARRGRQFNGAQNDVHQLFGRRGGLRGEPSERPHEEHMQEERSDANCPQKPRRIEVGRCWKTRGSVHRKKKFMVPRPRFAVRACLNPRLGVPLGAPNP